MQFTPLESAGQLDDIRQAKGKQIIFKHNTTCPISRGVIGELEKDIDKLKGAEAVYVLDLLEHRDLSDSIASQYGVTHQSPQILVIEDGKCTYHEWGYDITAETTAQEME